MDVLWYQLIYTTNIPNANSCNWFMAGILVVVLLVVYQGTIA